MVRNRSCPISLCQRVQDPFFCSGLTCCVPLKAGVSDGSMSGDSRIHTICSLILFPSSSIVRILLRSVSFLDTARLLETVGLPDVQVDTDCGDE